MAFVASGCRLVVAVCLLGATALARPSRAEKYSGIGYQYSLNDVRAMFPSATMEEDPAAWTQPTEKFYKIEGGGIPGRIRILFSDVRPIFSNLYQAEPSGTETEKLYYFAASLPDNRAYVVEWVRWCPDVDLPVSALIKRFGRAFKKEVDGRDFSETYTWPKIAVSADLNAAGTRVINVNYVFTGRERTEGMDMLVKKVRSDFVAAGSPDIPPADSSTTEDSTE